jgi:flagellar hook-associated protein 3 FlgL
MRVTEGIRLGNITTTLGRISERQVEMARRASSGVRLDQASTDPIAAEQVSRIDSSLNQTQTLKKNNGFFKDAATTAESVLAQGMDTLARAREIAMQGANGSLNAENRAVLAKEVLGIRDQLLAFANTKGASGYLFSGHRTDVPAFDASGTYQGDQGVVQAEIAPGVTADVNILGDSAFSPAGGVNVFAELATLANDLTSNNVSALSAHLTGIDTAFRQLSDARSQSGITMNRLDTAMASLDQTELSLKGTRSRLSDADAAETFSTLTQLDNTLQQAIAVARNTLNLRPDRF